MSALMRCAFAFLAAAAFPGATACGRIAGIDEYAVAEPDSGGAEVIGKCGAFSYGSDGRACRDCIDELACDAVDSCRSDGTCHSAWDCFLGCPLDDSECRGRCSSGNPLSIGSMANADFVYAISSRCRTPCRLGSSTAFTSRCNACLENFCDLGLSEDLDASRYTACAFNGLENPDDSADLDRCESQFPAGATKYAEARACFMNSCPKECWTEPDFSCAGHVSWPLGPGGPITLRAVLQDFVNGARPGIPNVSVRACATPRTLDCDPVANAQPDTSDSAGAVVLKFAGPMITGDYFAYLEATLETGERWLYYELPPTRRTSSTGLDLFPGVVKLADPTRGTLFVWAQSCNQVTGGPWQSSGVVISVPTGDAPVAYFDDAMRDSNLSETGGFGLAAVELEPGSHTVQARYKGELVAEQRKVIVRAQTVTSLRLPPTPLP